MWHPIMLGRVHPQVPVTDGAVLDNASWTVDMEPHPTTCELSAIADEQSYHMFSSEVVCKLAGKFLDSQCLGTLASFLQQSPAVSVHIEAGAALLLPPAGPVAATPLACISGPLGFAVDSLPVLLRTHEPPSEIHAVALTAAGTILALRASSRALHNTKQWLYALTASRSVMATEASAAAAGEAGGSK